MTKFPWRISKGALIGGLLLATACLFLTFVLTKGMAHPGGGDPAGTSMAQGFMSLALALHCSLLAALVLTAALGGAMPVAGRAAILLLAPAAFVAIYMAFDLLTRRSLSPGLWAMTIPGAAPTLIVAYCLWALIPPLRTRVSARAAGFGLLGALGLVCAAIIPMEAMRNHANAVFAARVAALEARLAAMPDDAHLPQWMPFWESGVYRVEEAALAKILSLPSLQRDAEAMLERDALPLGDLRLFHLDPTPALCQSARASLSRRAEALALKPGEKPDFDRIADEFFGASDAIRWLVGFACASDGQSLAWETLGRSYGASDIQVSDLVEARDPKNLGSNLYNDRSKCRC